MACGTLQLYGASFAFDPGATVEMLNARPCVRRLQYAEESRRFRADDEKH